MKKSRLYFIVALAIHLIISPLANAEYVEKQKQTLPKIETVSVIVSITKSDNSKFKLTKEQIQTDVELKLRLAGLTVNDSAMALGVNIIALNLRNKSGESLGASYSVEVNFHQMVKSIYQDKHFDAITWDEQFLGSSSFNEFETEVRQVVKDLVDEFLNDYLSVHPIEKHG